MLRAPIGLIDFSCATTSDEPLMWEEVIEKQDDDKWKKAIDEKYCTLMKNETWDLIELPKRKKTIESKWVFFIKRKANKNIDKY
jgi:hypothetical protein